MNSENWSMGFSILMHVNRSTYDSNCYTYNRVLGHGRAHGIGTVKADRDEPDEHRVNIKTIVTFLALRIKTLLLL